MCDNKRIRKKKAVPTQKESHVDKWTYIIHYGKPPADFNEPKQKKNQSTKLFYEENIDPQDDIWEFIANYEKNRPKRSESCVTDNARHNSQALCVRSKENSHRSTNPTRNRTSSFRSSKPNTHQSRKDENAKKKL